ncbi:uncharacterized protein LOC119164149 isoform X3 [Rhipicephalus microplus]|uniref:uncharacterized protein LOC119164149 isoform X3 n=1 Tax=Rhipicephalus microplus TaxID=6941 RepID=UPI0023768C29
MIVCVHTPVSRHRNMAMELLQREGRWYLGVKVKDKIPVSCLVLQGNSNTIYRCVNCKFVPETLCHLECRHQMCEGCFGTFTTYICERDQTVTRKESKHLQEHFAANEEQVRASEHLENAEKLVDDHPPSTQSHKDNRTTEQPDMELKDGTPLVSMDTSGDEQRKESDRGDASGSKTCPLCAKTWDEGEYLEHLKACEERLTKCSECMQEVKYKHYGNHLLECTKKDDKKKSDRTLTCVKAKDPSFGNYGNAEDVSERRQKVEEIEALKRAIKALEERIENLEKPLVKIIQKLRENAERRKY